MRVLTSLLALCGFCLHARCKEVKLKSGKIAGYSEDVEGDNVDIYLGIPYADPPVGDLRFKAPRTVKPWLKTRDTKKLPNSCWQSIDESYGEYEEEWLVNTKLSEDCLYLNVWAPSHSPEPAKRAVMVWIYGGGLFAGTSTSPTYDARHLAVHGNVIVVSMQYRVGALGFLYAGTKDAPGNMGFLDQALALTWVKDNIAAFGGDPTKVTIFGESAGGTSVLMHLLSPVSRSLFSNAIILSWASMYEKPQDAKQRAQEFGQKLNCHSDNFMACLRAKDPEAIIKTQDTMRRKIRKYNNLEQPFMPTDDGKFLTDDPEKLLQQGNFKKCSIVIGTTMNEGYFFMVTRLPKLYPMDKKRPISKAEFSQAIPTLFFPNSSQLLPDLVAFEYGTPYEFTDMGVDYSASLAAAYGDALFVCPAQRVAHRYREEGQKVYIYNYDHHSSRNLWPDFFGSMHGWELDIVFGHPFNKSLGYTVEEENLSRTFMRYLTNFAYTGDPNTSPLHIRDSGYEFVWPTYSAENEENLLLTTQPPVVRHGRRSRQCAFWEELVPQVQEMDGAGSTNGATAWTSGVGLRVLGYSVATSIMMLTYV